MKALAHAPRASLSNVNSYLKRQRKQREQTNEQVKSDKRNCKGNINEEYDACDEADNSNGQNATCNPEDNDMYNKQDYEELGRRARRKIWNKERKAQEKKRSKEESDEEYDRLARKVWKKNEVEKTRSRVKKRNTSDSNSDDLLESDKEYSKLVSEGFNKCKGDIMESNDSSDNDTEDKYEEEIYNKEESANHRKKNEDFERVEISDSDESQKLDPNYPCGEELRGTIN